MDIRPLIIGALLGVTGLALGVVLFFAGNAGVMTLTADAVMLPWFGFALVAVLLAVWVSGMVLTRRLNEPLLALAESVSRINRGKLERPIPYLSRRDGIGQLARALVALSARQRLEVSSAIDEAQQARRSLMVANNRLGEVNDELQASRAELGSIQSRLETVEVSDQATGLLNHRFFEQALASELKRIQRNGKALSVALYRVTGWSTLVRRHGKEVANGVMAKIGNVIADTVRTTDLVARYSDDSIVLMLPETSGRSAGRVVEDIHKLIALMEFDSPVRQNEVLVAGGLAATDTDDGKSEDIPSRLEQALVRSMAEGGEALGVA